MEEEILMEKLQKAMNDISAGANLGFSKNLFDDLSYEYKNMPGETAYFEFYGSNLIPIDTKDLEYLKQIISSICHQNGVVFIYSPVVD